MTEKETKTKQQKADGKNKLRAKRGVGRKMSEETVYKEDER